MSTSNEEIREWLEQGVKVGASHVIVMCDTFDYSDYPVYVDPGQNPKEKIPTQDMQKPMECYDLSLSIDAQMAEGRSQHWNPWPFGIDYAKYAKCNLKDETFAQRLSREKKENSS